MTSNTTGSVTLNHHSTISLVEVVLTHEQEIEQGGPTEEVKQSIWFDYYEWGDLKKAIENSVV